MSIIAIASRAHSYFPLIVLMNHDGQHAHATAPAKWWPDAPHCFGGRDEAVSYWHCDTRLGVTREGRFAAVTSYRDNQLIDTALPPIQQLTLEFLAS